MLKKRYRSAKQVDGVIDLERLRSGPAKCIERDPTLFLGLTYPSEDVRAMLQALSRRFSKEKVEGSGLILAEAVKGLGKSHAVLTSYHLFANPAQAKSWMESLGYAWNPPKDPVIITKKFTDQYLPFDSLWTVLDQELKAGWSTAHPPSLDELRSALSGKYLILVFDELERGISNIGDFARRSQNLSFLQMLSEEANRNSQVTLIAAIYDGTVEPGATLKRVPRIELRFRRSDDRAAIVRHRLFSNADSYDQTAAEALMRSYVNTWNRLGIQTSDDYLSKLKKAFPFLPELIELVFERISGSGGFQGTRGVLGLLAAMLDASPSGSYLLTAGHCNLADRACADRLQDLDPAGNLINCARRNFQDLKAQPYAEALASAVLLASLAPGVKGLTREELVRHVAFPGFDPNQFEASLQAFRTYGSYFHEREGRFFFDLEENENAKVEIEAIRLGDEKAREEIKTIWKQDLFHETQQVVIFTDPEATKNSLDQMPKNSLRFVLSPRRLSAFERHAVYFGSEMRNQILLFEPRDDTSNHLSNPDILSAAKRSVAAATLAPTAGTGERRSRYERIAAQERKNVKDFIKSAGLVYVRVERWDEKHEDSLFEMESVGQAAEKQTLIEYLRTQLYPSPFFVEHLREHLKQFYGLTIAQVEKIYKNTLCYPVPTMVPDITDTVVTLVGDRSRILGLKHERKDFCGENVTLGAGELPDGVLAQPWPAVPTRPPTETPAAIPPDESQREARPSFFPKPTPTPVQTMEIEERATPYCQTRSELRQAVAEKLSGIEGNAIQRIQFQIYAQYQNAALSDHASAIRGALTMNGDLVVQVDLTLPGPLDKVQAENCCESLPHFPNANYSARMHVFQKAVRETIRPEDEEMG